MSASPPLISAIIPAFNAERYVGDAVESVLEQAYPAVECIVIDDGSTDGTATVVGRYRDRIRYERQENRGVAATRNRGAALAQGRLLAFLDADDVWLPDRLSRLGAKLDQVSARAGMCAARLVDRDLVPDGVLRFDRAPSAETMLLQQGSLVSCSSNLLITREYFEEVGGFDRRLSMSADWDLLLRLVERGPVAYVDEPLVLYRWHGANMSHNIGAMEKDMLLAYEEAFERGAQLAPIRRQAYGALHWMLAGSYLDSGERLACARHLGKAIAHRPALTLKLGRAMSQRGRLKQYATR